MRVANLNLRDLWRQQKGKCNYCSRQVPMEDATIDHVIPRSRGGKNRGNTVMACWDCNNRKADMPADQFVKLLREEPEKLDRRPRLSEGRLAMWLKAEARRCLIS